MEKLKRMQESFVLYTEFIYFGELISVSVCCMQKRIGHMYTLFGIHIHIIYIVQRGFGIMEVKISHNAHKVGISFVQF